MNKNNTDYTDVTEVSGEEISSEQLERLCNRYYWAAKYIQDKDVIEVACGSGPGLGFLKEQSKTIRAGDYSSKLVETVNRHYEGRIWCEQFDAQNMPFEDNSADVIIIFEALYYIPSPSNFVSECKRVLRPTGRVLVSNANPDLFDFNRSPHSFEYHGAVGLSELFADDGFETKLFAGTPLSRTSLKQRLLRPIKKLIVDLNLMPRSMASKRLLKRIVFGAPVHMPAEISDGMVEFEQPVSIENTEPNTTHKVIFCEATLASK